MVGDGYELNISTHILCANQVCVDKVLIENSHCITVGLDQS